MAARNDPQRTTLAADGIKIEGDFDVELFGVPPIRMPAGIAHVEIPVTAHVIEISAHQAGGDAANPRVIQQRREFGRLVDKRREAGPGRPTV